MKKLIIALTVVLNVLTVACTSEKAAAPKASADYATQYNETMKNIIASDSKHAEATTNEQVIQNNTKVFNELKNTLQASGCYNEKIEKAYFNKASIEQGYKPAEFTAMCMIANWNYKEQTRQPKGCFFYCLFKKQSLILRKSTLYEIIKNIC